MVNGAQPGVNGTGLDAQFFAEGIGGTPRHRGAQHLIAGGLPRRRNRAQRSGFSGAGAALDQDQTLSGGCRPYDLALFGIESCGRDERFDGGFVRVGNMGVGAALDQFHQLAFDRHHPWGRVDRSVTGFGEHDDIAIRDEGVGRLDRGHCRCPRADETIGHRFDQIAAGERRVVFGQLGEHGTAVKDSGLLGLGGATGLDCRGDHGLGFISERASRIVPALGQFRLGHGDLGATFGAIDGRGQCRRRGGGQPCSGELVLERLATRAEIAREGRRNAGDSPTPTIVGTLDRKAAGLKCARQFKAEYGPKCIAGRPESD